MNRRNESPAELMAYPQKRVSIAGIKVCFKGELERVPDFTWAPYMPFAIVNGYDEAELEINLTSELIRMSEEAKQVDPFRTDEGDVETAYEGDILILTLKSRDGITIGRAIIDGLYSGRCHTEMWVGGTEYERDYAFNTAVMMTYGLGGLRYGRMLFHAATVVCGGMAYLFLGKSGTGKSTHASQWLSAIPGTELLNDDNPVVSVSDNGDMRVHGSPWSGKTPCYKARSAQLGGVVQLSQALENLATPVDLVDGYGYILTSVSVLKWKRELMEFLNAIVIRILTTVPVIHLAARPDKESALVCHATLTQRRK